MKIARIIAVTLALAAMWPAAAVEKAPLSANDVAAIRRVDADYVQGWLNNDRSAVLSLFRDDAVIVPQGRAPIAGLKQIAGFWWPAHGNATTVTSFRNEFEEIGGSGDFAFSRGTYEFTFDYEVGGHVQKLRNRGNYLMLFRRDESGAWKISHRMWSDLPR